MGGVAVLGIVGQAPGLGDQGTQLSAGRPQVRAHGPQLLTAMIGGLDDGDDPQSLVALEAMAGLAKLLSLVEPEDLRVVLLHTAIRIRPFFDSVGGGRWGGPLLARYPPHPPASGASAPPHLPPGSPAPF